jgi:hypothetical protein
VTDQKPGSWFLVNRDQVRIVVSKVTRLSRITPLSNRQRRDDALPHAANLHGTPRSTKGASHPRGSRGC